MDIKKFWFDVLRQDREAIRGYFHPNASIKWHNTNELFNLDEFIIANCDYPGQWDGIVERIIETGEETISITNVFFKRQDTFFSCCFFL